MKYTKVIQDKLFGFMERLNPLQRGWLGNDHLT